MKLTITVILISRKELINKQRCKNRPLDLVNQTLTRMLRNEYRTHICMPMEDINKRENHNFTVTLDKVIKEVLKKKQSKILGSISLITPKKHRKRCKRKLDIACSQVSDLLSNTALLRRKERADNT